jgi:hypothetical protein
MAHDDLVQRPHGHTEGPYEAEWAVQKRVCGSKGSAAVQGLDLP